MTPKAGQIQLAWGQTARQAKYGYRSVMFVRLVSGGQFPKRAHSMQTWGDNNLPEGSFDSIEEAEKACEEAGIDTAYAIYV